MELGLEMEREQSPARYLRRHRSEFPVCGDGRGVPAAIEAAVALESCEWGRARRCWRIVVRSARRAGRAARRDGVSPRRFSAEMECLREAMETVLFDGRLPPDLASWATRSAAKMCARAMEHALCAYWQGGEGGSDAPTRRGLRPPYRGYGPEPRVSWGRTDLVSRSSQDQGGASGPVPRC